MLICINYLNVLSYDEVPIDGDEQLWVKYLT